MSLNRTRHSVLPLVALALAADPGGGGAGLGGRGRPMRTEEAHSNAHDRRERAATAIPKAEAKRARKAAKRLAALTATRSSSDA